MGREGKRRWSRMMSGGDRDNVFHSALSHPTHPPTQQFANWSEGLPLVFVWE
jgi:hypothetical protein